MQDSAPTITPLPPRPEAAPRPAVAERVGAPPPEEAPGPADDGTMALALGIVTLTCVAGMIEVVRRFRRSEAWPVPLVIYATLLPIVLFLALGAARANEPIPFAYAVLIPVPLLALAWWLTRGDADTGETEESRSAP